MRTLFTFIKTVIFVAVFTLIAMVAAVFVGVGGLLMMLFRGRPKVRVYSTRFDRFEEPKPPTRDVTPKRAQELSN